MVTTTTDLSFDAPSAGALRVRLRESQWRMVLAAAGSPAVPAWAEPMTPPDEVLAADDALLVDESPVDASGSTGPSLAKEVDAADAVLVDPALVEAAWMRDVALVEIEVAMTAGNRGLEALVWATANSGSSVVRGMDLATSQGAAAYRLRPGIEVNAFSTGGLLDEVLRLVPPAPVSTPAPAVTIPEELTITLASAIRDGNTLLLDAICRDLRVAEPPAMAMAIAGSVDGSLTLTVRSAGRADVSVLSLLRCSAGWVELTRTRDDQVRHQPQTQADIIRMLLFDVTGRMDTALRASTATTQEDSE